MIPSEDVAQFILNPTTRLVIGVISLILNCFAVFYVDHAESKFYSKKFYSKNKKKIGWLIGILSAIILIYSLAVFYSSSLTSDTIFNILEFLLVLFYIDFLLSDEAKHGKGRKPGNYDKFKSYMLILLQLFIIFSQLQTSYKLIKKMTKAKSANQRQRRSNNVSVLNNYIMEQDQFE